MRYIGMATTALVGVATVALVAVGIASIPDIKRYLQIRRI
jgi:hypothetical protein